MVSWNFVLDISKKKKKKKSKHLLKVMAGIQQTRHFLKCLSIITCAQVCVNKILKCNDTDAKQLSPSAVHAFI